MVIENILVGEWVVSQVLMQLGTNRTLKCSSIILLMLVLSGRFYNILTAKSRFVPAGGMHLDN